eukprot:CAMPEP_0197832166 /NCGR_PEP_ID=MMETSP1437-20131217/13516_1 /TAXON_ID=49252 ORGANISM="Eucampia antarctica, Strain CCMP1452" /NCGR_SAMPLE_ID=MMETSP1437 /ASSEMBLY_ACC=CAM_ASM_001096 /LENGTH=476 /DNA_ID=CAMNT_0043435381 /DNA_START=236 /DNA_END=1663 /DNA_ORIENTATION=-
MMQASVLLQARNILRRSSSCSSQISLQGNIPVYSLGGGNRIYAPGSSIGSDPSMIAANDRCSSTRLTSTITSSTTTRSCIASFRSFHSSPSTASSSTDTSMDDEYGEMTADGHTFTFPKPFKLENGQVLEKADMNYMTYGQLNETRDNVLVVCHALTGNASLHSWWSDMLGPGNAFDTNKYFVVCSNILGSCYGSTGPSSIKPDGTGPYGMDFPDVSVQDTVRLQLHMLQDELQIRSIKCVIGGSFGGMQAVEYAAQAGHVKSPFAVDDEMGHATPFVRSVMPIACGAKHTAWQIAISEVQRQAIYADPKWNNGDVDWNDPPTKGLSVARQMGMLSYRTPKGYETKFGRNIRQTNTDEEVPIYGSKAPWQVKSYLEYQGQRFLSRFDPITYVKLTEQMDAFDVGRGRGGAREALSHVRIPALILGIDSDILYPIYEQKELASFFSNGEVVEIHSDAGHDGFLLEQEQVATHITEFL